MKKIIIALTLFFINASVFAAPGDPPAGAGIGPMNYQGRLLDDAGIPVTGTYTFTVRIYDALTGGNLDFEEEHTGVSVDDGVYSFLIGQGEVLSGSWDIGLWNNNELYLEIEVNNETLTPRHRLAAAPFAFQANLALTTNNALALGNKTAAEYDNILANICVSSKGKWLELADNGKGACLGIGASFPGNANINWWTLTSTNNFSNLDLSRADISGINFYGSSDNGPDFTGTIFNQTIYSIAGLNDAILKNTVWDGAIAVDAVYWIFSGIDTDLHGATFKNMDMSKWNLSELPQARLAGLSAAALSGCPVLPGSWECRNDGVGIGGQPSVLSFLAGPGVNLSANSAAAYSKFGASYLNLADDVLNNIDLNGASFEGNVVTQNFTNTILNGARFDYTTLKNNVFDNCFFVGTQFNGSKLDKTVFLVGSTVEDAMFINADLNFVRFDGDVTGSIFSKATLTKVGFIGGVSNSSFSGALLNGVKIGGYTGDNNFTGSRFYNGFTHGTVPSAYNPYTGGSTFDNVQFIDGTLSGDFTGAIFGGTGADMFDNIKFEKIDLCAAEIPLFGINPPWQFATSTWTYNNVTCPSGGDGAGGGCGNSAIYMTPTAVGNCAPGAGTFGP